MHSKVYHVAVLYLQTVVYSAVLDHVVFCHVVHNVLDKLLFISAIPYCTSCYSFAAVCLSGQSCTGYSSIVPFRFIVLSLYCLCIPCITASLKLYTYKLQYIHIPRVSAVMYMLSFCYSAVSACFIYAISVMHKLLFCIFTISLYCVSVQFCTN